MNIRSLGESLGEEVLGVDASRPMQRADIEKIQQAIDDHSVIVLRDQHLDAESHIAFSRNFGQLMRLETLGSNLRKDHPEIFVISNVLDDAGTNIGLPDAGKAWHVDASYERIPSYASLFYAIEIPRNDAGETLGETEFASTYAAYDALSPSMKDRLHGLKAIHRSVFCTDGSRHGLPKLERDEFDRRLVEKGHDPSFVYPDVVHPVVRTDPKTGRRSLFVNQAYTVRILGMAREESDALLAQLYEHVSAPGFRYVHKWSEHDLVIWDNLAVQHKATFNYKLPQRRVMHRTTVLGNAEVA